jgi:hypothetical protein
MLCFLVIQNSGWWTKYLNPLILTTVKCCWMKNAQTTTYVCVPINAADIYFASLCYKLTQKILSRIQKPNYLKYPCNCSDERVQRNFNWCVHRVAFHKIRGVSLISIIQISTVNPSFSINTEFFSLPPGLSSVLINRCTDEPVINNWIYFLPRCYKYSELKKLISLFMFCPLAQSLSWQLIYTQAYVLFRRRQTFAVKA